MIVGIGIDIAEVVELESRIGRKSFLRAFTSRELEYAESMPHQRAEILAGRWAAKEAFAKALGTGIRTEWSLAEIEIGHDENGRPVISLAPRIQALLPPQARIHCSITHTRACAAAVVFIEQ